MIRPCCGYCKHFEQAPLSRRGWCRNPLLYSPQQSHLVWTNELDCERGMGNYWEPSADFTEVRQSSQPLRVADKRLYSRTVGESASGTPVYPVTGSSGYGSEPPPPPGGSGGPPWGGGDRDDYDYFQEERYWTDYLRIAAPILGVLLMVALFWFWIASWLGDDNGDDDTAANGDQLPTTQITETPDEDTNGETPESPAELPTDTPGAEPTAPGEDEEPEATEPPNGENGENGETVPGGEIFPGATVEVANTGGTGVNVRSEPSLDSEILNVFLDGIQATTTDDPVEAEGFVWWPITHPDVELGWIVEDYLVLVE